MRCLRRILNIKWDEFREDIIINFNVRFKFNNIGSIETIIAIRRLLFLGKSLECLASIFQLD